MFKVKKKSIDYETKSIRMPAYLVTQVQELADKYEISFNSLVIQCIDYALSEIDKEDIPEPVNPPDNSVK